MCINTSVPYIASALILSALLTGCGQAPIGAQGGNNTQPAASVDSPERSPNNGGPTRAMAQQALDFIVSRLDKMDLNHVESRESISSKGLTWTPSAVSLASSGWTWTEKTQELFVDSSGLANTETDERFRVSPKLLTYPVGVKQATHGAGTYWMATVECAASDCFEVRGRKNVTTHLAFSEEEKSEEMINQQRQSNSWWFSDEDTARRVAHAVDVVLEFEGAQKRVF